MPGSKFNHQQLAVLDSYFGSGAPATIYIALYTVLPTAGGGGVECSGGGYARVPVTNNTTNWPAASGSGPAAKSNGTTITFPTCVTTAWATGGTQVCGWGSFDTASAGNGGYWGPLNTARPVNIGDTPSFAAGALSITET